MIKYIFEKQNQSAEEKSQVITFPSPQEDIFPDPPTTPREKSNVVDFPASPKKTKKAPLPQKINFDWLKSCKENKALKEQAKIEKHKRRVKDPELCDDFSSSQGVLQLSKSHFSMSDNGSMTSFL